MNRVNTVIGIIIVILTMVGSAFTIDSRYAKKDDVQKVAEQVAVVDKRLEIVILKDRANALQERLWKIEDRYGIDKVKYTEEIREQFRTFKKEYNEILEEIKDIKK